MSGNLKSQLFESKLLMWKITFIFQYLSELRSNDGKMISQLKVYFSFRYYWLLNVKLPQCAISADITINTPKMCTVSRPCVFIRLLYLDHIQRGTQTHLWTWPCFVAECFVEMLAVLEFWAHGEGYKWKTMVFHGVELWHKVNKFKFILSKTK